MICVTLIWIQIVFQGHQWSSKHWL